ncbi:MAG: 50S ribosomal protein L5 [Candidatus Woesearchaeota archaeon]
MKQENAMREIIIEKVTLNIGVGKNPEKMDKAVKLLSVITGKTPIKTVTNKRLPAWGLRPGLPIGCKVTLRKEDAESILKRLLDAVDGKLKSSQFDNEGNISFGIHEYISIPGTKYDPEIGLMGLQACITLERRGFRIKRRKIKQKKISKHHKITKEEAIAFMKEKYGATVE